MDPNQYETHKGFLHAYLRQLVQLLASPQRNSSVINNRVKTIQTLMNMLTPDDYRAFYELIPFGAQPLFEMPRRNRNNRPGPNYSQNNLNTLRRVSPETYNWLTKNYNK